MYLLRGREVEVAHVEDAHFGHNVFIDWCFGHGPIDGYLFTPKQDTLRNELATRLGCRPVIHVLDKREAAVLRFVCDGTIPMEKEDQKLKGFSKLGF